MDGYGGWSSPAMIFSRRWSGMRIGFSPWLNCQMAAWNHAGIIPPEQSRYPSAPSRSFVAFRQLPARYRRNQLEIRAGEETTELRFSLDGSPRRLVVHHFSPRLLKLGRRFVADFAAEDDPVSTGRATNTAALETAIHNGRLIMLKMSGAGAVLGEQRRLWIRPVLLDGAERYLVYGETINHPR
jgi:hypothetical protein